MEPPVADMSDDDVSTETARALFLVYGKDARQMAALRCKELEQAGDTNGLANWRRVLAAVEALLNAQTDDPHTHH
jgi:hypothetical protein